MRLIRIICICTLLFLLGCTEGRHIKLRKVLNSPEEYDGKEVEVIGIFHYRSEDVALYKKRHSGQDQAVWVDLSDATREGTLEELHNRRITIKGTFSRSEHGHLGAYAGTLKDATIISE